MVIELNHASKSIYLGNQSGKNRLFFCPNYFIDHVFLYHHIVVTSWSQRDYHSICIPLRHLCLVYRLSVRPRFSNAHRSHGRHGRWGAERDPDQGWRTT